MHSSCLTRRRLLNGLAASVVMLRSGSSRAQSLPGIVVTKDPACGCCSGWVDHLREAGFSVRVIETADLEGTKRRLGVPADLAACHTAEVSGYVVEGHVPAAAIRRLLAEKPNGRGLAVPGMPVGSPGMEVEGVPPEIYTVLLFGSGRSSIFARYRGTRAV